MSLQMVYGRAHSGKTKYILDAAKKLHKMDKPFIIVVPEQFTHLAEKRLISEIGYIESGRAEVLSFNTMAKHINALYPSSRNKIGSIAKSLIMSEIISDLDLEYYQKASSDSGFVDVCMSQISEFKKYKLSVDNVINASSMVSDKGLSLKLNDLGLIYKSYEERISKEYADSDDELGMLYNNLNEYKPYSSYTIFFDEFSSFNPIEKQIISSLISQTDKLYVALSLDFSKEYSYLFKTTIDTAESIKLSCEKIGCKIDEPVVFSNTYYDNEELMFLEKNIYSYPNSKYEKPLKNIRIYANETPHDEVALLCAQIKALVMKKNIRYRDINVICSDISSYSEIIRSCFAREGIPVFIDEKTPVLKHSVISHIINILDVYLSGYSSSSMTSFLKSGHLNANRADIINVDNFIRATNASKNVWLISEKWNKVLQMYCKDNIYLYNSINDIREKYVLPLARLHDRIKGKKAVKNLCEALYDYLIDSKFDINVSSFIEYFKVNNNPYMAKKYESVWRILVEAMDMLCLVMGDKIINVSEFKAYLTTAFSEQKIGSIPASADLVTVSDIKRSKLEFASHQFIIGATDDMFPGGDESNSLIGDGDKTLLSSIGIELSPAALGRAYFEKFLLYSALTHPSKSLIISYPLVNSAYAQQRPAFVLTLLKNIFPELEFNYGNDKLELVPMSNKHNALEYLAKMMYMQQKEGELPEDSAKCIYKYFCENSKADIEAINSYIRKNPALETISPELCQNLFKDEFYSTISRIQKYNSCRYAYYLEYMLKLREKEDSDVASTDIGSFIHLVIEKSFEKMEQDGMKIEQVDADYFKRITEPIFEENLSMLFPYSDELTGSEAFRLATIKENSLTALMQIKEHIASSEFRPIGHEISFNDKDYGCIELQLDNGKKLKLTGKIDRADSFQNENGIYIRVIDYKTGNKTFSLNDVYMGLDLQLIVYLNALVKGTEHAHHAGALYFKIQKPIAEFDAHPQETELIKEHSKLNAMTGLVADDEYVFNAFGKTHIKSTKKATPSQLRILSDYVEAGIVKSANDLSMGKININPYQKSDSSPCDYCPYSSVCLNDRGKCANSRHIPKLRDNEVWEEISMIKKEVENT